MMNKGFTLAEVLVVMAITAIVGTILVLIFTNTLRGSNKSQILSVMKQNGQAVMDNIDRTIRESDNVVCPAMDVSSDTLVVVKDGFYSRFKFKKPLSNDNAWIKQDNFYQPISGIYADDTKQFLSDICNTELYIQVGSNTLTDTGTQTGVSVDCVAFDCSANPIFIRNKSSGYKDQIIVKFILNPGVGVPPAIAGQIDPMTFQTTIELR